MDQKILDQIGRDHARKYIHDLNPYVEPKSRKPKERIIRTHAEMYARDIVTGSDSIPEENTRKCISAADIHNSNESLHQKPRP